MANPNDKLLLAAHRDGDTDAFGKLYDAYAKKIYDYVYYRTQHRETAEDLTSDIFTNAFAKIGTFDGDKGTFSAWLYRIARNRVIDHYRSHKRVEDIEDIWDALASGEDIARDVEARTRLAAVEKQITALPAGQREVLLLRVWDQLSYAEIAEATGKSEAACKMAFSRAVAELRKSAPLAAFLLLLAASRP